MRCALLLLAKELDRIKGTWPLFILPIALVAVGLFLILDPIVFHGGDFGAEGAQHQIQGALMLVAGAVELRRARGKLHARWAGAVLPIVIIVVGLMFAIHAQHGGGDVRLQLVQHRITGCTVIFAGIVLCLSNLRLVEDKWPRVGWLLLLLAVCIQLFLYAEGAPMMTEHDGH